MVDPSLTRGGREYAAGQVLFREGESGAEMFIVQAGLVEVTKRGPSGDIHVATLGRGEFLGEMAILNGKPRTATARVVEDARCLVIDGKTLESLISNVPEVAVRLVKKLAERLAAVDELVQILLNPDPKARVMLGLKRHAEAFGELDNDGVRVRVTPDTLANEVGVELADVESVLERLRRLRLVSDVEGGWIHLSDLGRLLEFLEFLDMTRRFEAP